LRNGAEEPKTRPTELEFVIEDDEDDVGRRPKPPGPPVRRKASRRVRWA